MKRILGPFFLTIIAATLIFTGCINNDLEPDTGMVTLSLTDAPLEDDTLTGVWITVTGVEFHTAEAGWQIFDGAIPDDPINLMELTSGATEVLGADVPLPSGRYNQIRFLLDIQDTGDGVPTNPGCYLTFDDDNNPETDDLEIPLFVPSGDTSGYKAVKSFTVPVNGSIAVTADFDLRKAVVDAGTPQAPHYILKPTIRLVVDGEAGWIHGPVVQEDVPETVELTEGPVTVDSIVAFAYTDGTWAESETDDPVETESRFGNSVTSAPLVLDADPAESSYKLAFLAAGIYDVAVALYDIDGSFLDIWGFYNNAEVIEGKGTVVELSNTTLSSILE